MTQPLCFLTTRHSCQGLQKQQGGTAPQPVAMAEGVIQYGNIALGSRGGVVSYLWIPHAVLA